MGLDFNYFLNRQGIQGKRGERGEQGFSPLISVKTQTANEYILTVQNEDGSFDTPNLRGNAIANNGGTYIRYNPLTEKMYTGNADYATNEQAGVVLLASYDQLIAGGSENLIPTSQDVYNFVSQQIISGFVTQQEFDTYTAATAITLNNLSTQKLSFVDLSNAIVAGNNITLSVDSEDNTITINAAGGDLSNYVTLDTAQTITNSKTFNGNGVIHFSNTSNGVYFEDSSSTERIRIFTARHSSGVDYSDLTMQSYSDMQFRLLQPTKTVRLTDIITANTLANSAVQPEDMATYLADYVDLTTDQSITGTKTFNNLRVENQLIVSNGYIQSGGTSDLRIRSTASSITLWGDHIYATTDNINKVDLTHAQVTDNLVTSIDNTSSDTEYPSAKCVYDNLETKADKSQTHALKGYSDNGELLTDAEGLADVKNYAHSTFDASKFTKVGSPVVTDDGIASGFSSSNYLTSNLSIDFSKDFDIIVNYINQGNITNRNQVLWSIYKNGWTDDRFMLSIRTGGSSGLALSYPDGADSSVGKPYTNVFSTGNQYIIKLSKRSSNLSLYVDNTLLDTITIDNTYFNFSSSKLVIGTSEKDSHNKYLANKTNFKQFSITVDNIPVFSGNKTGIDTIKPDDYTVVGSPTITNDGVASGFSGSDYLQKTLTFTNPSSLKLFMRFKTLSGIPSSNQIICQWNGTVNNNRFFAQFTNTNKLQIGWNSTTRTETQELDLNTEYDAIFTFTGTKITTKYKKSSVTQWTSTTDISVSDNISGTADLIFGNLNGSYIFDGSIDLNSFKIYIDGNLVYQPCLKIPYTESKTGSKIVSSSYRDRVNDMAEQFGYAPYYTLSDTNFTLPQVELYGLIGDKTLRDSYYNGVTYWELFSNRRLEQGGTCESGVEYTLPRPFADANYVLTIPYSSKTATSFIPSATGDFIAKGRGLL